MKPHSSFNAFIIAALAFSLSGCGAPAASTWTPTPGLQVTKQVVTMSQEQTVPTWTESPTIPPASPEPTVTPAPTASATAIPTYPPTRTASATPDIRAIAAALVPLLSGQGVAGTAAYHPNQPGPHPVVLLTTSSSAYLPTGLAPSAGGGPAQSTQEDWNALLPQDWLPAALNKTELAVLIGPEREINLGSQAYKGGPPITAYRYEVGITLREAATGKSLASYTFKGSDPRPFPQTASVDVTRLEGSHLNYAILENWLCPLVTQQGCWEPKVNLAANVSSSTFSPDGKTLASFDYPETSIKLWRVPDGSLAQSLDGHTGGIMNVAFSPDGQNLAASADDASVSLWKVSEGSLLRTLEGVKGRARRLTFAPDGQTLAALVTKSDTAQNTDVILQLWQVSDGSPLSSLDLNTFSDSGEFSPDLQILASNPRDGTIHLWHVLDGSLLRDLKAEDNSVNGVTFSPDGQTLAAEFDSGHAVELWRVPDGTLLYKQEQFISMILPVFSPNGQILASGDGWGKVQLWQASDGSLLCTFQTDGDMVTQLSFSPDGQSLVSVNANGTVQLWRVSDGSRLRTLKSGDGNSSGFIFSPDGQTLAIGEGSTVNLWRIR